MAVQIKPLEDRILVEVLDAETKTASGLVIPDTAKEKPQEGKVIAVGPGRFDEDGEPIMYSKTYFMEGRFQFLILRTR